ncbi:inter-alpha-trypsin inhibitor heavy chain H6 isoform X3 [Hemicordylus capensis]|uniref:inter-alpha-trypsin inhibitor heavy chain H6 isoform X3 n=1 Tax=Hemicordylus capensis TaxID=884348 RepID=UPI002302C178|nr:inter-alpha-trypsin inhibitor heavy chain H6 isoform X3 [Hemicordylus capensis]
MPGRRSHPRSLLQGRGKPFMPAMDQLLGYSFCLLLILMPLSTMGQSVQIHTPSHERYKRQGKAPKTELTISSFLVHSMIVSRYASTRVWMFLSNPHTEAKEAVFDLDLPSSAFVSNFTITVNEKVYVAEVKEKHQAKKMYDEARRQGKTAAHVGTKDRETEKFRVSTSVEAGGKVAFELTYEELLQRHLGKYQHAISIRPQQVVRNLSVEVSISERTGIDYIHVLPLRTSRLLTNALRGDADVPPSTRVEKGTHCAWIIFTPTLKEQAEFSSSGIMGDFVVQYDVAMPDVAGDVQIYNGYFVHYFAPRGLPPIQKDVVFVIDVSGSMYGIKMKQTKKAMHVILSDLHQDDYFNIVTFSDTVNIWKPSQSIQATPQNIRKAKEYVSKMEVDGWTDINAALLAAASVFNQSSPMAGKAIMEQRIPLIIFLTDGEPTSGVTAGSRILTNAQQALKGTISLFGLAFGDDADYGLLRRLSLENRGVARRIYEDADATLQLKGFYDEIASPLLYDVELAYLDGVAQDLTQNFFPNYFQGSELVVAGRVKPGVSELRVHPTGHGQEGPLSLENDISANTTEATPFGCSGDVAQISRFVQRLWAYFTIQDLLQARFRANDTAARRLLTEKATNLSLKYNFVTPVTSLIVVRPEEDQEKERKPVRATIPPGVTRALKTTPPAATSALPWLSKVAKTTPPMGATSASVVTKMSKGMVRPGAVTTSLLPRTASGSTKAVRITSPLAVTMTTVMSTIHTSPVLPGPNRTKAVKVTPIPGSIGMSLTPVVTRGSTKTPKATTPPRVTRPPIKPSKPSPIRAGNLKVTVQPPSALETRGTAMTKVLGGIISTVLPALTTGHPSGTAKVLGGNSSTWEQLGTTPQPATEHSPHTNWLAGPTRLETGHIPWSKMAPKGGALLEVPSAKPPLQNSTVPWGTAPGTTPLGAELGGTSSSMPSTKAASDISLLLLPGESELRSAADLDMEYVESLNPPAVYSFVTAGRHQDQLVGSSNTGLFTFSSWVDGDPHFVVSLPQSLGNLCFTLDGRSGDILRLVSDPTTGLSVNGHLMGAPSRPGHEERPRTYFDAITLVVERPQARYVVDVTRERVALRGEDVLVLPFTQRAVIHKPQLAISLWPEANVTVWIGPEVEFLVLLHRYSHPTALQRNHLGFYVVNSKGLSASAHGLLGQFPGGDIRLSTELAEGQQITWLWRGMQKVLVTEVTKVLKASPQRAHKAACWLVKHKDVEALLGAPYSAYLASHLLEM